MRQFGLHSAVVDHQLYISYQCIRGKHTVYNDALTPFQTGGDERRSIGCQIEPASGFTHEGIYRHVASSNDEKHEHSPSRQCVDNGEFRRQVACRVARVDLNPKSNLLSDRSVPASAVLGPSLQLLFASGRRHGG
jgi:hypothetical protein